MALRIYKGSGKIGPVSTDGEYTNPILWTVTDQGGTLEQRLFLSMDEYGEYAEDIRVYAIDAEVEDEASWVEFAPEEGGGPGEYASEFTAAILPLGSEIPFWAKTIIPPNLEVGNKTDISIQVAYVRFEVEEEE